MSEREWCCERLEEETGSPGGWGQRTAQEEDDGSLTLVSVHRSGQGPVSISGTDFDYCPFCGTEVTDG